jgi:acyl-CoA reductase-like NAD-dependent aldehyde dehydrogenase
MLEVRDPADVRSVVGEVPEMTAAQVAGAYSRARAGFATWRRTGVLDRAAVLARAAGLIRARLDDGATTVVRENGKTLAEARVEVTKTADFLDYYASFARQPWGELLSDARPGTQTSVRVEPVGVVLAICPWNDPLITPARKLGPALIAGNAVLLKAASQTPLIATWVAGLLSEAGLPEGVLQVITGRNSEISAALLAEPDAVTFTGSNQVGGYLRRALADRNVRLQAELGGKNVSVVLADADLEMAAATIASAAFAQAGQRCTATSRLIVQAGAKPARPDLEYGCYVEPTLIRVTPAQSLWREEVFGPVLAITTATGFEDAVRLANDTTFGLAAAVFTSSLTASATFIDLAEAGQVAVNLPTAGWDVHHPFGGFRESGSPFKEQGSPGLRFYTRIKTAAVRYQW